MKICVFGAGSVGGFVAASLAHAGGHEISAVARGAQLAAAKSRGLTVRIGGREFTTPVRATGDPAELGVQDIVLVTLKAPAIGGAASALKSLIGPETAVAFLLNGIPWWYHYGEGGSNDGAPLNRLDPGGAIWSAITPQRVIGGVAYCSATVVEPGTINIDYPEIRFDFGEPDDAMSSRLAALVDAMNAAGLTSFATPNIRERIWSKLVLNMATGPMAILSGHALGDLLATEPPRHAVRQMLGEGLAITEALGLNVSLDVEQVLAKLARSRHKPSILQDLEAGRPMEIDGIYVVPLEIARARGVPTPMLDVFVGLARLRARAAGLYHE